MYGIGYARMNYHVTKGTKNKRAIKKGWERERREHLQTKQREVLEIIVD